MDCSNKVVNRYKLNFFNSVPKKNTNYTELNISGNEFQIRNTGNTNALIENKYLLCPGDVFSSGSKGDINIYVGKLTIYFENENVSLECLPGGELMQPRKHISYCVQTLCIPCVLDEIKKLK